MRCTVLAAAFLLPVLSSCTGSGEPLAVPDPDLCVSDTPVEECLDRLQLELSRVLERTSDGEPIDQDDLEQALAEVVRPERIGLAHSFRRITDVPDRDADEPVPTTPVEFRLGVGDVQRTYWACLPTTVLVTPGPCAPAP